MELTRKLQSEIRALHTRHGRKKSRLCCCEGLRAVRELFAAAPELVHYCVCTPELRTALPYPREPITVSNREFAALTGTVNAQGVLAVSEQPPEPPATLLPEDPFLFALDRLGDPGNFGTICRTLLAAGLHELWFTGGTVDPWSDKSIRSALGAQFRLRLRSFPDLNSMARQATTFGYRNIFLTDPHHGENCFTTPDLFDHSLIVIGCESTGVGELPGARHTLIPMPGNFESLNAAQAATIFLFESVRRHFVASGVK